MPLVVAFVEHSLIMGDMTKCCYLSSMGKPFLTSVNPRQQQPAGLIVNIASNPLLLS